MEFPGLGQHCGIDTCNRLDFLPMKCDACSKIYCKDHFTYNEHNCPEAYRKDNQVPVCPLCNRPIPVGPGQTPDGRVGQHIDSDCQSNPAKEHRGKIFKNRCSLPTCKKKEMMPLSCPSCRQNFCLSHRLEADHNCEGFQGSGRTISDSAAAALKRQNQGHTRVSSTPERSRPQFHPSPSRPAAVTGSRPPAYIQQAQVGMTEDEALAMALRLSAAEATETSPVSIEERQRQEREDRLLAEALAASEQESRVQYHRRHQQRGMRANEGSNNNNCNVS